MAIKKLKRSGILVLTLTLLFSCASKKSLDREEQEHTSTELPERFSDSTVFQSFSLDFNHDGKMDVIYLHKALEGDSLFAFTGSENGFILSLETINFTEGGLYFIEQIESIPGNGFQLITVFNGAGAMKQTHWLVYDSTVLTWTVQKTITEAPLMSETRLVEHCTITQNLLISENTDWSKMHDKSEGDPAVECITK